MIPSPRFEEISRPLKDLVGGRWVQGWGFPREGWGVRGAAGEHAQFVNMLATCPALHGSSHYNVGSTPGCVFTSADREVVKRSLGKECREPSWIFPVQTGFVAVSLLASYLVLAGRRSSLWNLCPFLTSSACSSEDALENEKKQER